MRTLLVLACALLVAVTANCPDTRAVKSDLVFVTQMDPSIRQAAFVEVRHLEENRV